MKFIYFLVAQYYAQSGKHDSLGVLRTYFEKEGGFTNAFLLAVGIAAVCALVYYIIAKVVFKWPSLLTWVLTAVLCCGATFAATGMQTGVHATKTTKGKTLGKLPSVLDKQVKNKMIGASEEQKTAYAAKKQAYIKEFNKPYLTSRPVNYLCWTNVVLAFVFFYLFSILLNGIIGGHGANTPHRGLFTSKR